MLSSITRHTRSYGHPLHPDLTLDVLTCVLPQDTVRSGKESEDESANLSLTIIQFLNTQALAYTTKSLHIHLHTTKVLWRWTSGETVAVGYTGSCSCRPAQEAQFYIVAFREEEQ